MAPEPPPSARADRRRHRRGLRAAGAPGPSVMGRRRSRAKFLLAALRLRAFDVHRLACGTTPAARKNLRHRSDVGVVPRVFDAAMIGSRRVVRLGRLIHPGVMLRSVVGAQAANIMPGSVRSRAPISFACSNASVRRRGNNRRLGGHVPVGTSDGRRLRARPQPSASLHAAIGAHAGASPRQAAPAAVGRAKRNSAPSTHIRCPITPIRRATATTARFIPRRRARCRPQAFSQHGLA